MTPSEVLERLRVELELPFFEVKVEDKIFTEEDYQQFKGDLLRYFDEETENCGQCDICVEKGKLDITEKEFDLIYKWMEEQVEQARVVARRRLKFNGDLVREWTGLEGKQLGVVIKEFKGYVTNEELDNPEITATYIKNSFLRWFEAHKHELL